MRVAFRTDASIEIGTGHVMRCLTLAATLRERGATCVFLCRPHDGHLLDIIAGEGHSTFAMPCTEAVGASVADTPAGGDPAHAAWLGAEWPDDAQHSLQALADHTGGTAVDWLIVDHYALDARWEAALRPACARLMVIDDLADRPHDCDLLLDQSLGRTPDEYRELLPPGATVLVGPQFALLRPEFARLRDASLARRAARPALRRLLVTMGGVDKDNATGHILDALAACALPSDVKITVVMGPHAPWLEQVRNQAAQMRFATEVLVGVRDMARIMAESDLAIGAAGMTAIERCALGLPTVIVAQACNQVAQAEKLANFGAVLVYDPSAGETGKTLATLLRKARQTETCATMSAAAAKVTDGDGLRRLVQRFEFRERGER